jgi:hypothetical protein
VGWRGAWWQRRWNAARLYFGRFGGMIKPDEERGVED